MDFTGAVWFVAAIGLAVVLYAIFSGTDMFKRWTTPPKASGIAGDFDFAAAASTTGLAIGAKIVTRLYRGNLEEATRAFQVDAATMASSGYRPTSQSYSPGSYSCAAFLVALILCFVLIGFLIFIYMVLVKPPGSLAVTYARDEAPQPTPGPGTTDATKVCPRCAETVKAAALVCRYCGTEFGEQIR